MQKKKIILLTAILVVLVFTAFTIVWLAKKKNITSTPLPIVSNLVSPQKKQSEAVSRFSSKEEMRAYLEKARQAFVFFTDAGSLNGSSLAREDSLRSSSQDVGAASPMADAGVSKYSTDVSQQSTATAPQRISETNVQVLGIDEPDIVKTDGKNLYFSSTERWVYLGEPVIMKEAPQGLSSDSRAIYPSPEYRKPETKIITAFPPAEMKKIAALDKVGNLLLVKNENILVIMTDREILAYDVSNPAEPKEKWKLKLEDKTTLLEARLHAGKIYLITRNYIDRINPCPIRPLTAGAEAISIDCKEIYHPQRIIPTDATFSVMVVDPTSGQIKNKTAFVGSTDKSNVYMSENAVYVAYGFVEDFFAFMTEAISQTANDLLPAELIERLNKIKSYDLSGEAKMIEFNKIVEDHMRSLSNDETMRLENELENRLSRYLSEHMRELEKTGIVKIKVDSLAVEATGSVPGTLLNQFSLDEYKNNLRVAVTVGSTWGIMGIDIRENGANDVYILDRDLKIIGEIKNLGVTEEIYSARFVGERGYLVTFRRIDPFYVLDLSDPKKPEMKGELKIPGYSSYLHPLSDNIILGIGQEEGKVKLSLFDVKNPSDPQEIDKYLLSEYWSEAQSNHHAFLQDADHKVFFLPGGKGGYVFSYADNKLALKKTVSDYQVKRAVYIDDYLYIIGESKISALDEKNWEKIKELEI